MCNACVSRVSTEEAFAERMVGLLDAAAVVQMISVGHRTELFDAMRDGAPHTAATLARRAGLHERYVREWLGAMAAGGIVETTPEGAFRLPETHAACLTRDASAGNLAATCQFLPVLAGVEDEVVECFRSGGGVPYASYPRFHEVMAEESDQTVVAGLDTHILPLADGLVERLERGIDVLDVGCGRGRACLALAERYPRSRFKGIDLSEDAIAWADDAARRLGLNNARFECRDLSGFEPEDRFDLVTAFDAVHDQADPAGLLAGVRKALRPGGLFLMQDIAGSSDIPGNIGRPLAAFIYTISCMHCMTVSLAQGGAGLGAAWGEQRAEAMLREAGFRDVTAQRLDHDIMNVYYLCRP